MERIGILVVSYGSRATAMVDAFYRSRKYDVELYIVDKQRNPFNIRRAQEHVVIPSLSPEEICKFAQKHRNQLDFGIVGPEDPIIAGVRNLVERATGVPMVCPTKEFAIEGSKVSQRILFQKVVPEVNPQFKIFDSTKYSINDVKKPLYKWLDVLNNKVAVKPDKPAVGKGVGVWGDHFNTREQLLKHFLENFKLGPVIVEEKIDGEESSFQVFCDGRHLVPLPDTRDHKRAFDGDLGPNTGGMGSYMDNKYYLPFMTPQDREKEVKIVERIFNKLKKNGNGEEIRGMPFYVAFMHTRKGPMILENNSRPGDPEIMNILPVLKDDFVEVCLRMIEGSLTKIAIEKKATVTTYKVPPNYGGYADMYPERVDRDEIETPIILDEADMLTSSHSEMLRIYPAAVELRENGKSYALRSRTICSVGIGDDLQGAREVSLRGLAAISGGALWNRTDIASMENISKSVMHMEQLRKLR